MRTLPLYIDLSFVTSADSKETADGLVINFDDEGHIVGIEFQHASEPINLSSIDSKHLLPITHIA